MRYRREKSSPVERLEINPFLEKAKEGMVFEPVTHPEVRQLTQCDKFGCLT